MFIKKPKKSFPFFFFSFLSESAKIIPPEIEVLFLSSCRGLSKKIATGDASLMFCLWPTRLREKIKNWCFSSPFILSNTHEAQGSSLVYALYGVCLSTLHNCYFFESLQDAITPHYLVIKSLKQAHSFIVRMVKTLQIYSVDKSMPIKLSGGFLSNFEILRTSVESCWVRSRVHII